MFEIRINPASLLVSLDRSRGSQPHSFPPDPNQTINATELKRDKQVDNITDAARPVTRSAKSQSPTLKFVKKPTPISAPRRRNHNVARHQATRYASPHNPREIWKGMDRVSGEIRCYPLYTSPNEPRPMRSRLLNRASMAAAIDAESDIPARRLQRDPASEAAVRSQGCWRVGIAGLARRLPPGARVWIPGGARLALVAVCGCAHFYMSLDAWVPSVWFGCSSRRESAIEGGAEGEEWVVLNEERLIIIYSLTILTIVVMAFPSLIFHVLISEALLLLVVAAGGSLVK
jgi:hypothetical protein